MDVFEMEVAAKVALGAFALGLMLGALALKSNFCTMGSLSDIVFMEDWRRFRSWMLAAAVAILGTQTLHLMGLLDIGKASYLTPNLGWAGYIIGGLLFGYGMTMAGGCGNKTAVRVGAGNLKSIVVFLVMGFTAYVTARGIIGLARMELDKTAIDLKAMGMASQGIPAILASLGLDDVTARIAAMALVGGGLLVFCFKSKEFLTSPVHLFSGIAVGLLIVGGWAVTGIIGGDEFDPQPLTSFTFVGPTGDSLQYLMIFTSGPKLAFGVAGIFGVIAGSFLAAILTKNFHIEAFTDAADMKSHLVGAVMMGVGGVLANGCTFGQGITGMSTMALGSLMALVSICIGGVWGLKAMEEGSVMGGLKAVFARG
jgi:uncharacterized membrane protein YedE/YeeE